MKKGDIISAGVPFSPEDFDASTPEEVIAAYICYLKIHKIKDSRVIQLLPQEHVFYAGRGANQINRIRGFIFASFEQCGLPENAFVYVCEELENSRDPYVVAGAAMAVRGLMSPDNGFSSYLCKAIINIGFKDNSVNFETYKPDWNNKCYTTATREILLTLQWLGKAAENSVEFLCRYVKEEIIPVNNKNRIFAQDAIDAINNDTGAIQYSCCRFPKNNPGFKFKKKHPDNVLNVALQNQDGKYLAFRDFFCSIPTVVTFFYTRCDNPSKCSLTISKLANLQLLLEEAGLQQSIKIAAITYDSGYDKPEKIKSYLENRQFRINDNNNGFRVINDNKNILNDYFSLGVNFIGSIVNHHRIELFILNERGAIIEEFSGLQWEAKAVASFCKRYLKSNQTINIIVKFKKYSLVLYNSLITVFLAFFPKCPICWAAYLSALGISGVSWLKYDPKYMIVLIVILLINNFISYRKSRLNNYYYPLLFSLLGSSLLIPATILNLSIALKISGIMSVITSSLLNTFSMSYFKKYTNISG